jgi:hypothetical protein
MSDSEKIVCKPTKWFLVRGVIVSLMFVAMTGWFYHDGEIGYRRKNASFYLQKVFKDADAEYKAKWSDRSAEEWRAFAAEQTVAFPPNTAPTLPPEVQPGMMWPEVLQNAENLQNQQWNRLWERYSAEWSHWKMDADTEDEAFTLEKIQQQHVVAVITALLALVALFYTVRTLFRRISIDGEALYSQTGKRVPLADFKKLDLRKWQNKGLAFADYEGSAGKGRVRIDGLTYGGFNKAEGEPAERLLRRLRENFSGEIIEYVSEEAGEIDSSAKDD